MNFDTLKDYARLFLPKSLISLKGYTFDHLRADLISGITVGVVALPLTMAFAIASGVSPAQGIYTAIIAGFLSSLLGGSYFQISGPTGAFVVVIYTIMQQYGYDVLALSTLVAGIFLVLSGLTKAGALIKWIPEPLISGFTTGIAVVIFSSQINNFFGIQVEEKPGLFLTIPDIDGITTTVATTTLFLIAALRRWAPKIPWTITGILFAMALCYLFNLPIETISSRFGEIPSTLPKFQLPHFSFEKWDIILQCSLSIAFLAGLESLLSATVADSMTGRAHKSHCELVAQGVANFFSSLFGGIPSTGAIARTAVNINSGAKSPFSGMIHALTLLLILLYLAPLVSKIPLAAISSVLIVVAWNMAEIRTFRKQLTSSFKSSTLLLTTFILTVAVDLIIAIEIGILVSFLFYLFQKKTISQTT